MEGRIDSNNAAETDKEIAEAVAANTDAHLAIDTLVRTDRLLIKDMKTNKVLQIAQEIGRQPVLSFGNSSGDMSMHNYAAGSKFADKIKQMHSAETSGSQLYFVLAFLAKEKGLDDLADAMLKNAMEDSLHGGM